MITSPLVQSALAEIIVSYIYKIILIVTLKFQSWPSPIVVQLVTKVDAIMDE
jgi:hypothetical protein